MFDRPSLIAMPSVGAHSLHFMAETGVADPPAPAATPPAGGAITDPGGVRQIARGAGGKAGGAGGGADDFSLDAVFKDDKFLGGRFDSEGHTITRELFEGNEALQRMAKSFHSLQGENTKIKQGKVALGNPLTEQEYGNLDFSLSEEGTLPEATVKALKGRPIGDHEINLIGQLIAQARAANASVYSQWWSDQAAAAQSAGVDLEEAFTFAGESMDDETMEQVNAALRMPKFRDAAIQQVIDHYRNSSNAGAGTGAGGSGPGTTLDDLMGGGKPEGGKPPLRAGDPPRPPEGGLGGVYSRNLEAATDQYTNDLTAAGNDATKRAAVEAKWQRSVKAHRWQ